VPLLPPASGGVADAEFWGGGVAILKVDIRVVVATDIEAADSNPRDLADPGVGDEEHDSGGAVFHVREPRGAACSW